MWKQLKNQFAAIKDEAMEDMNKLNDNSKLIHINVEKTDVKQEVGVKEGITVKSLKPNIKKSFKPAFKPKSKNIDMLGTKEDINYLPCNKCKINDLCKKAYSLNMPKYDITMFELDISCSRIIEENNMEEEVCVTKEECLEEVKYTSELPCKECAIADICSKAHSLKLPDTKEVFTIGVSCKRFINK